MQIKKLKQTTSEFYHAHVTAMFYKVSTIWFLAFLRTSPLSSLLCPSITGPFFHHSCHIPTSQFIH